MYDALNKENHNKKLLPIAMPDKIKMADKSVKKVFKSSKATENTIPSYTMQ